MGGQSTSWKRVIGRRLRINLYGTVSLRDSDGEPIEVPYAQLSAVAVLAALGRPVRRSEVEEALVSSGLLPAFSRLKRRLGAPVHRVAGARSGFIELNDDLIDSDLSAMLRILDGPIEHEVIGELLVATAATPMQTISLSATSSLTSEIEDRFASVRFRCRRRAALLDLAAGEHEGWLLPEERPAIDDPGEVWLAYFDRRTRAVGPRRSGEELESLPGELGPIESPHGTPPTTEELASLVIETAHLPPLPAPSTPDDAAGDSELVGLPGLVLGAARNRSRLTRLSSDGVDEAALNGVLRAFAERSDRVLGCWEVEGATALATLHGAIAPLMAHAARRPGSLSLQPLLISMFRALTINQTLGRRSDYRFFVSSLASILRRWAGDEKVVFVIGRRSASSTDVDRLLVELVGQCDRLSVVIVHRPAVAARTSERGIPFRPGRPGRTIGAVGDGSIDQALAVVAVAAHGGYLLVDLGVHLLARSGSNLTLDDVVVSCGALARDGADIRVADDDRLRAAIESRPASDRQWLVEQAARWLVDRGPPDSHGLGLLIRLARSMSDGVVSSDAAALTRRTARLWSNQGSHAQAVDFLTDALQLPLDRMERVTLLIQRGDDHRILGDWSAALVDYREAASTLAEHPRDALRLAEVAMRMARLTWDPAVGREVDALLELVSDRLPTDEVALRARVALCRAGGSFQDGTSATGSAQGDIEWALGVTGPDLVLDPEKRAWARIHGRKALLGAAPLPASVELAEAVVADAGTDVELLSHGHKALYVDALRGARWADAGRELEEIERLARTPLSPDHHFTARAARVCWDLAKGRIAEVESGVEIERSFRDKLDGLTYRQVVTAHDVWIAREKSDVDAMARMADLLIEVGSATPGSVIWPAAAAMLLAETGDCSRATRTLRAAVDDAGGLESVRPGAHRLPTLAMAAEVAYLAEDEPLFSDAELEAILHDLRAGGVSALLVGWPALILGSVERFQAMVVAALGRSEEAASLFAAALAAERSFPALCHQTTRAMAAIQRG